METKFTKGEWICPNNPETDDYVWVQQKGFGWEVIAHIHRVDKSMMSREESIANLKLILAAPDLFKACEEMMQYFDNENLSQCDAYYGVKNALKKAIE